MKGAQKGAKVAVGLIGGLLLLSAVLNLVFTFAFRVGSPFFSIANALLTGWLAIGFLRGKDAAWIFILLFLALTSAVQLAVAAATRDVMVAAGAGINVATIALIIWAGRQLPDAGEGEGEGEGASPG